MTPEGFWALIDKHVSLDDDELDVSGLEDALAALPAEEIVSFDQIFAKLFSESYSWKLWGAAYIIRGGCSDDSFDYFRGWLIARGRKVFEAAIADPDSLAEVAEQDVECEDMLNVAASAYETATDGTQLDGAAYNYPDLGDGWDFDDAAEMRKRYPKLAAKLL